MPARSSTLFDSLNRAQGYGLDEIAVALHHLIREEVVSYRFVEGEDLLSFSLAEHFAYTVIALGREGVQRYCFHVRAGTPEVAVRKIRETPEYHHTHILAIVPGFVEPVAEPICYLNHGGPGRQPKDDELLKTVQL